MLALWNGLWGPVSGLGPQQLEGNEVTVVPIYTAAWWSFWTSGIVQPIKAFQNLTCQIRFYKSCDDIHMDG